MTIAIDGADRRLPDEAREQRSRARRFADEVVAPLAEQIDREARLPATLDEQMAHEGFFGLNIPERYGGRGSVLLAAVTIEELSRVSAAAGLAVAVQVLGSTPLVLAASEEQAREWLPTLAAGRAFCSYALTEPNAGTDASNVETSLTPADGAYLLNGHKHYISGATRSALYTVFARSGPGRHEMTAVLVPADTPGFTAGPVQDFSGMRGMPIGNLFFHDVRLPDTA
ncbi:MAG: acyl-CoA dehydrogenase family protein, partial [Thermomicrobiaceae bacterium]|nr:acyl-CoA dehydrogenase family protein [Thermomicrobiaceae bacterium]